MVNTAYAAWINGHIPGVLRLDSNAAFLSVGTGRLINLIKVRQMYRELI